MYGNNNNGSQMNNGSDVNVNTTLRTSNSDESSMNISLWNNYISLKISPAIGVDSNGVVQYDRNRRGQTALSSDAAQALFDKFKEEIYPHYIGAIEQGEIIPSDGISVTVETGKDPKRNIVGICMKPSPTDPVPDFYFVIHSMADTNNVVVDANINTHRFPKRLVRINYNPATGISEREIYSNSDFNTFLNILGQTELMLPFSDHVKKYTAERSKGFNRSGQPANGNGGYGGYSQQPGYGQSMGGGYSTGGFQSGSSFQAAGPVGFQGMNTPDELPFT